MKYSTTGNFKNVGALEYNMNWLSEKLTLDKLLVASGLCNNFSKGQAEHRRFNTIGDSHFNVMLD